jgi:hypothetical protein
LEASFAEASLAEFAPLLIDLQVNIQWWDARQGAYEKDQSGGGSD